MCEAYLKARGKLLERAEQYGEKALYGLCKDLSDAYRQAEKSNGGVKLRLTREQALAYALLRMPPTYAAARRAMELLAAEGDFHIKSLLDAGAGTGSAYFAAKEVFGIEEAHLIEREEGMAELLKELTQGENCTCHRGDMRALPFPKADLAVASYALLELPEADREAVLKKLYEAADLVLIVEPGTSAGYERICSYKRILKKQGAEMLAPCPDMEECRLKGDWCQFTVRVQRNAAMRRVKNAELGYEDENFLFLAVSKAGKAKDEGGRLIKRPKFGKARAEYTVCTPKGVEQEVLYKRDAYYKEAKKLRIGDRFLEVRHDRT